MERHAYVSLAQCLSERVVKDPDRTAYIFLQPDGGEQHVSYRQLYADALLYAHTLAQAGIQPGDLVLLIFDHGYEVIAAFWGAIHFGAVPTILPYCVGDPLPTVYQSPLTALPEFAGAKAILTTAEFVPLLRQWARTTNALVLTRTRLARRSRLNLCQPLDTVRILPVFY